MKKFFLSLVILWSGIDVSDVNAAGVQADIQKDGSQVSGEIRSGQVLDAKTGKPIEGAAVLFVSEGDYYETMTDKQGNYVIRGQFGEEEVYIYKYSYLWYHVYDGKVYTFLSYLPNLKQDYRHTNNIVNLEPFVPEMSHEEHMRFADSANIPREQFYKALEPELKLARQEPQTAFIADQSCRSLALAYKSYTKKEITDEEYAARLSSIKSPELRELEQSFHKEFGNKAAIPALIAYAKKNIYRGVFDAAVCSIGYIYDKEDINYTRGIGNVPERIKKVDELEQWWKRTCNKSDTEVLCDDVLHASDQEARLQAVVRIGQLKDPGSVPCLLECLNNPQNAKGIIGATLRALGGVGDKSAIPDIKKMLLNPDPYIRKDAALALHALGDNSGVAAMTASLESPNKNTRWTAVAALSEITDANIVKKEDLRQMPEKEKQVVLEKWKAWWNQNKGSFDTSQYLQYAKIAAADKSLRETMANQPTGLEGIGTKDNSPLTVWKELNEACMAEDAERATKCFVSFKQDEQRQVFQQMKGHLREMAEEIAALKLEEKLDGFVMCEFLVEEDDGVASFPVNFSMDFDGKWKISDF